MNNRFKEMVKRQRGVVARFPRSKYLSSLTRTIETFMQKDLTRSKSSFVKNFR
jgi:hypothetical protein